MLTKIKLNKPILIFAKLFFYSLFYAFIYQILFFAIDPLRSYFSFGITILIIILNRGKLSRLLQKIVDRSFYHKLYRLKKTTDKFTREINVILEYDELVKKCASFLDNIFSSERYLFYLYNDAAFESVIDEQANKKAEIIPFPENQFSNTLFTTAKTDFFRIQNLDDPFIRELPSNHIQNFTYFIPLTASKKIVGFILVDDILTRYMTIPEVKEFMVEMFINSANMLENASIHSKIRQKSSENQHLLDVVKSISATLNLTDVLESIIENLGDLIKFDAGAIVLVNEESMTLNQAFSKGYNDRPEGWLNIKVNQGLSGWVIRNKKGLVLPDVNKHSEYYPIRKRTRSQITMPIISRDIAIGALVLESNAVGHFTRANLTLLSIFSGLVAIAIRNAQLYEDSVKKQRLESDLLVASGVQKALLPKRVPAISGINIDVLNIPSQIVGGDLYDVFRMGNDKQGISIGDVSGKGAPAAILMAVVYAGFKSLLKEINPVVTVIAKLNNFMVEATTPGYYVTFFYGIIDQTEKTLTYCNAGHNPPLLLRKDLSITPLNEGGIVLGFLANQKYKQEIIQLKSGDYLCFFTDGVTEIMDKTGEEFGDERLEVLLKDNHGKSPRDIRLAIIKAIKKFTKSTTFQDDLTLLIVEIE